MLNRIKKGLVLTAAFLVTVTSPAMAIPDHIKLDVDLTINNGGDQLVGNSIMWYSKEKGRVELNFKSNKQALPPGMGQAVIVFDTNQKVAYMITPDTKTALKLDMNTMNQMQGKALAGSEITSKMLTDPSEFKAELKKQGGKMIGSEKVLGYLCDVWQVSTEIPNPQTGKKEPAIIKSWLAHKLEIPLKMEITSPNKGKFMTMKTKDIETSKAYPSNLFEVPKGYKITDLQMMMQQLQNMQNNK